MWLNIPKGISFLMQELCRDSAGKPVNRLAKWVLMFLVLLSPKALAEPLGDPVKISSNKTKIVVLYYPATIKKNSDQSGAMMVIHFQEDGKTKLTGRILYRKADCVRKKGEYIFLKDGSTNAYRGEWDAGRLDRYANVAVGICYDAWGLHVL